jgi:hypothetical protein
MSLGRALSICVALAVAVPAHAQWKKVLADAIPRASDGRADLSAPAPRLADGTPDLSGVWLADIDPTMQITTVEHRPFARYFVNIAADMKPEDVPLQPWAADLLRERMASGGTASPAAHCGPMGIPQLTVSPLPHKIVQTPELVLVLHEENQTFREIFLDDREPVEDAEPRYMGYSTGRWEGDTLVVSTRGFKDRHWLDAMGHPSSSQLRLTERYRRLDAGRLEVEVTVDDPGAYTRPITVTSTLTLMPDEQLLEYFCAENEKSSDHYR